MSAADPLALSPLGWFLRWTVGRGFMAVFRVRLRGAENLPDSAAILAGNHISYGDPVLMWCSAPRPVRFMAKAEMWDSVFFRWLLPRVWTFPVRRDSADRAAIARALAFLADGQLVAMFPEGTRNVDGRAEAHAGVAFIACKAGVPVVPVGVSGTDRIRPPGSRWMHFPRVTITYGEPVRPEEFAAGGRRENMEAMTAEIMRRIAGLVGSGEAGR